MYGEGGVFLVQGPRCSYRLASFYSTHEGMHVREVSIVRINLQWSLRHLSIVYIMHTMSQTEQQSFRTPATLHFNPE